VITLNWNLNRADHTSPRRWSTSALDVKLRTVVLKEEIRLYALEELEFVLWTSEVCL
jgi:hypothetical protein